MIFGTMVDQCDPAGPRLSLLPAEFGLAHWQDQTHPVVTLATQKR